MVKLYIDFVKKFNLPDTEKLVELFDFKLRENVSVREVRREIYEKFFDISKELEEFVYPESSLACMEELSSSDEKIIDIASKYYKKCRKFYRQGQKIAFSLGKENDKIDAEYIENSVDLFLDIRSNLGIVFEELEKHWNDSISKKNKENYFG